VRVVNPALTLSPPTLTVVAKAMKTRDVIRKLRKSRCSIKNDNGPHTTWLCPCGRHTADIPRHTIVSPGVIRDTVSRMTCLPKGWLQ